MKALKLALLLFITFVFTFNGFAQEWDYELGVLDINTAPADYNTIDGVLSNEERAFYVLDKNDGTELYAFDGSTKKLVFSSGETIYLEGILDNGLLFRVWEVGVANKVYFVNSSTLEVTLLVSSATGFIDFVRLENRIVFSNYSDQLYSTDGTSVGTYLLQNYTDFNGELQVRLNDLIIYVADDKLWRTDGTSAGTYVILNDAPFIFSPDDFVASNGKLFFQMTSGAIELWATEGTVGTTEMVYSGFYSQIFEMVPTVNGVAFDMSDAEHGRELWVSDGSTSGTHLLLDINPGIEDGIDFGNNLRSHNGIAYFKGGLDYTMPQLWRTDGTLDNTEMLIDFSNSPNYNSGWLMGDFFSVTAGRVVFSTNHTNDHETLWSIDESAQLTELAVVNDVYYSDEVLLLDEQLCYINNTGGFDDELWITDGTPEGTILLYVAQFMDLRMVQDSRLFFTCRESGSSNFGEELYSSDGTAPNTALVRDINVGSASSNPEYFFTLDGAAFFLAADNTNGLSIYTSDGLENGTLPILDINPETFGSNLSGLMRIGGKLYFQNGSSLFSSDGTTIGTQNINISDAFYYYQGVSWKGDMVFGRSEGGIFRTDGTLAGTEELLPVESGRLIGKLIHHQDRLYFVLQVGFNEYQLWYTNGTAEGTELAFNLSDNNQNIYITSATTEFTAFQGMLYFIVYNNGDGSIALWKTDGTTSGAVLVKNFGTAGGPLLDPGFTIMDGLLYFHVNVEGEVGIWSTDGTENGTALISQGFLANPVVSNDLIFYSSNDGLWRTDGTAEGTFMLTPQGNNYSPDHVVQYENGVIFSLYTQEYNYEPWISDGTVEGTHILKVIDDNGFGSSPHSFTAVENQCIFTANDDEIWVTDGTEENTFSLGYSYNELNSPEDYTLYQDKLFFIARNQIYGEELFYFDLDRIPSISGFAFIDDNENGQLDEGELELPGMAFRASGVDQNFTYSNQDGFYNFFLLEEGNYIIDAVENECWELTGAEQYNIAFTGQSIEGLNFGFRKLEGITSLHTDVQSAPTRCGFTVPFWANVYNTGCEALTGIVEITLDDNVIIAAYDPDVVEVDGHTMIWSYESITPSNYAQLPFLLTMPGVEFVGNNIEITVNTYQGSGNDAELLDTYIFTSQISCAIDPNDKLVRPARPEESGSNYTQIDETLYYTIRFQNTGNDTAFTVRILDQLAPELDWETFQLLSASHEFKTTLFPGGEVEFLFEDILLPDSTTNEVASHGYVAFSIELKEGLEDFTEVQNTARIYFDYNSAIITNTITNTIVEYLDFDEDGFPFWEDCDDENPDVNPDAIEIPDNGIDDDCDGEGGPVSTFEVTEKELQLFPNPASRKVYITSPQLLSRIELLNALGRTLLTHQKGAAKSIEMDIADLSSGFYFVRGYDANGRLLGVKKLIKE